MTVALVPPLHYRRDSSGPSLGQDMKTQNDVLPARKAVELFGLTKKVVCKVGEFNLLPAC